MKIPEDMIYIYKKMSSGPDGLKLLFSRMRWEPDQNERRLRILTENNLDCIFEMSSTDPTDKDPKQRYLKLISVCKIDNLYTDTDNLDSHHFYHEPFTLKTRDVLERLIRMN